ncbi:hypothetical protein QR680_015300 [Steinernema hermaphroditum]|uniref:Uncharacterized protein n=1 Tax=Steinernema hermaphroditum TaxID=289476 RepID=A0AA39LKC7_9BILA|nr:hypothetical protein QR680_015300 [Steinernema hermaphroditum]
MKTYLVVVFLVLICALASAQTTNAPTGSGGIQDIFGLGAVQSIIGHLLQRILAIIPLALAFVVNAI